ncbi:prolyl endopeptidase-like [Daphnia carinata]|uniref:prolyl endopeptidase-like n=1 Tax=Daphnia carinata TaxID=120202 RepID=UPI00257A8E54|nr:prolyl endopeptidase-like [Daphnia carinata]
MISIKLPWRFLFGGSRGRALLINSSRSLSVRNRNSFPWHLTLTQSCLSLFRSYNKSKLSNASIGLSNMSTFTYPVAKRIDFSENLHGITVEDPYRWLEDPDSSETQEFVRLQNELTTPYIQGSPALANIKTRLTELWNFPKYSCPTKKGNRYFFYKNSGLQNHSVLFVQDTLESEPRIFLDPNTLSDDGTVSLSMKKFSEDGEIFAYGLSRSGSDWNSIHFKCVETGEDFPEVLEKIKFSSISWTHDNKGVFYSCYPEQQGKTDGSETTSNENHKLFYHLLGTQQSEDILVVEFPHEPKWRIQGGVTDCGRYLIVTTGRDCQYNNIYFCDLTALPDKTINGKLELVTVVDKMEADYEYVTNTDSVVVFRTNKDAPNYRLIQIDFNQPARDQWKTLLEADPSDVLDWVACINKDKLIVCYMHDVKNILQLRDLKNGQLLKTYTLEMGTVREFSGKSTSSEFFFQFGSFLTPGVIYRCDIGETVEAEPTVFRQIELDGFDPSLFETQQVFYPSKDGTRIPMFIVKKKTIVLDGTNPCLMYGYGGFNISLEPAFSVTRIVFMQHFNGVFAVPNIRGGGEYGEAWHDGGRLFNKQNSFDDFHSAAEYLIANGYTSSSKLAIQGASNGGLLIGACVNQRPELYAAGIAHVGVMDMLRFHKFTVGYCWVSDYGNPDEKEPFENLLKFSPLHNLKVPETGQYPAMLLLTADHDDRVVPLHSLKYMAQMHHTFKDCPKQTNPLMIRIETKAGHGANKPTSKIIDEHSDVFAFLARALNLEFQL